MPTIFSNLEYPFETKFTRINNCRMAYVDEGKSDKVILFIHGLGSYIPAWKFNITELKRNFRCIAIDLPGFGKSDKPIHSGKMEYYSKIILSFIENLHLRKVNLVGHSMGGQIAINCALSFPKLFDKLVLIASAGFEKFTKEEIQIIKNLTKPESFLTSDETQIKNNFNMSFFVFPPEANFLIQDRIRFTEDELFYNYCIAISNSIAGMIEQPAFQHLKDIKQKTLIIFGKDDKLIPNKYLHDTTTETIAKEGTKQIPNAKLFLLNHCGHFVQIEKSSETNKLIKDFISDELY